jgi:hypothetical protein
MADRFVVRAVVVGLGGIVLACVVAAVVLALHGNDMPEFLKYVGTTALGAFAGVLAKTSTDVQPVAVVDQPVATTEVAPRRRKRDKGATAMDLLIIVLVVILVLFLIGLVR